MTVDWRVRKQVLKRQQELPESNAVKLTPDVVVGPYVASFVDENQKLILEVVRIWIRKFLSMTVCPQLMPKSPVGILMRRRHFSRLGYTMIHLSGKDMTHTKNPVSVEHLSAILFDVDAIGSSIICLSFIYTFSFCHHFGFPIPR